MTAVEPNKKVTLRSWIMLADTAFEDSRQLMFDKVSKGKINELRVPAFLLHWSIELYLKAFLFNKDKSIRGHDLVRIFNQCLETDPKINSQNFRTEELNHDQDYWIAQINHFGNKDGGFRYLNQNNVEFSFYIMIHEQFDEMITYIKEVVDGAKDITLLIDRPKV